MRWVCFFVLVALIFPDVLTAQDAVKVTGVVKHVDPKQGTVTVRPSRKGATDDETYSFLKKDIEVATPSGEKVQLDRLAVGQTVQLKVGLSGDVESILILPASLFVTVADVDTKNRTIKIAREASQFTSMSVAPEAKIWVAGRSVYLRELKPGSEMKVTASLDGKTALGLTLVSDPDGKLATKLFARVKISKLPGVRFVGVLTEIDPGKRNIKLSGPKTKNVPKSMPVADDANIQVIYAQVPMQSLRLDQVVKMTHATLMVAPDNRVTRIFVDPPTIRAKVKSMDGDNGKLTVQIDGKEKTFSLQNAKVMNGTRVMRLADLQPDLMATLVLSLDRELLLAVDIR